MVIKRSRIMPFLCCCICLFFILIFLVLYTPALNPNGQFLQIPCSGSKFTDLEFPFPKIIHMAFEYDSNKNATYYRRLEEWIALNPGFEYRTYNLKEINAFVLKHSPDLVPIYRELPLISKIDFWRYLVMYIEGGLYVDSDVSCLKPVSEWLTRFKAPLGVLVGLESVVSNPKKAQTLGYLHRAQISNWMLLSVPGHPLWLKVLKAIRGGGGRRYRSLNARGLNLGQILDIVGNSGPGRLTAIIVNHLSDWGISDSYDFRSGGQICDIGILPHGAVGTGYAEEHLGILKESHFIDHAFEGSWKSQ